MSTYVAKMLDRSITYVGTYRSTVFCSSSIEVRKIKLEKIVNRLQRPVFNNMVCPQGWSLPLWVNLAPRGEICSLGGMFNPSFTPGVNTLYVEEWRREQWISPQGITIPLGDKFHPWGSKFAPTGEVKNGPLVGTPKTFTWKSSSHLGWGQCYDF
jgi:hypothetical protein